jgi:hypothetical protein
MRENLIEAKTEHTKNLLKAVIKKVFISIVRGKNSHVWHEFAQKKRSSERIFSGNEPLGLFVGKKRGKGGDE